MDENLKFFATLWPSFSHFEKFTFDTRLSGIRLNSAMMHSSDLDKEFGIVSALKDSIPLYFDIKGRQLRVIDVNSSDKQLELKLNHPIEIKTPVMTLLKGGSDSALLTKVIDGKNLIFDNLYYMPRFEVYPGESLHLRDNSLKIKGPTFLDYEIEKIQKAKKAGFKRYFLSYVQCKKDVDEFKELVGDSQIILKIEDKKGLEYVANDFKKEINISLMAARGDLYVEIDKPHEIFDALRLIIDKDCEAGVGSRILLSLIHKEVPECADLTDISWLYDIGYRNMMLCDELCLKDECLSLAVNVLDCFRKSYSIKKR